MSLSCVFRKYALADCNCNICEEVLNHTHLLTKNHILGASINGIYSKLCTNQSSLRLDLRVDQWTITHKQTRSPHCSPRFGFKAKRKQTLCIKRGCGRPNCAKRGFTRLLHTIRHQTTSRLCGPCGGRTETLEYLSI